MTPTTAYYLIVTATLTALVLLSVACDLDWIGPPDRPPPSSEPDADWVLYDALAYQGRPDSADMGMVRMPVLTASAWWPHGADRDEPHEQRIRERARVLVDRGNRKIVVNIEHWPTSVSADPAEVEHTIDRLRQVVAWIRDEAPDMEIGIYAMVPDRNYWRPVQYERAREALEADPEDEALQDQYEHRRERLEQWQRHNAETLARLAEAVDFICPSIYAFYDTPEAWRVYAEHNIREAQRYGKPVYPFIWAEYHPSNADLRGTYLDADYWRQVLTTVRMHADGAVLWGGYRTPWPPAGEWWGVTESFIEQQQTGSNDG